MNTITLLNNILESKQVKKEYVSIKSSKAIEDIEKLEDQAASFGIDSTICVNKQKNKFRKKLRVVNQNALIKKSSTKLVKWEKFYKKKIKLLVWIK